MGFNGKPRWSFSLNRLYQDQNTLEADLDGSFEEGEVAAAVKGMNRQSAPGPDGFGPSFYGAAWTEIKSQVMEVVSAFHPEDLELERINMSYMVLVPKKSGA
jgi:hypothetical protein